MTTKNMRTDLTDSYEDLERVLEDYFRIIPSDMMFIKVDLASRWEYDDLYEILTLHFDELWQINEFISKLEDSPKIIDLRFDQTECVDYETMTVKIVGKNRGLY